MKPPYRSLEDRYYTALVRIGKAVADTAMTEKWRLELIEFLLGDALPHCPICFQTLSRDEECPMCN